MRTTMAWVALAGLAVWLGGCAMESTEVPTDDGQAATPQGNNVVGTTKVQSSQHSVPPPLEFHFPGGRADWQENALRGGTLQMGTPIPDPGPGPR